MLGPDGPPPRSEGGLTIINALLTLLHGQFGKLFLAQIFGEMELSLTAARIKEERKRNTLVFSPLFILPLSAAASLNVATASPLFSPSFGAKFAKKNNSKSEPIENMHIFCKKLRKYRYVHVGEFPRLAQRPKDRWSPFYRPWRMAEEERGEGRGCAYEIGAAPLLHFPETILRRRRSRVRDPKWSCWHGINQRLHLGSNLARKLYRKCARNACEL